MHTHTHTHIWNLIFMDRLEFLNRRTLTFARTWFNSIRFDSTKVYVKVCLYAQIYVKIGKHTHKHIKLVCIIYWKILFNLFVCIRHYLRWNDSNSNSDGGVWWCSNQNWWDEFYNTTGIIWLITWMTYCVHFTKCQQTE